MLTSESNHLPCCQQLQLQLQLPPSFRVYSFQLRQTLVDAVSHSTPLIDPLSRIIIDFSLDFSDPEDYDQFLRVWFGGVVYEAWTEGMKVTRLQFDGGHVGVVRYYPRKTVWDNAIIKSYEVEVKQPQQRLVLCVSVTTNSRSFFEEWQVDLDLTDLNKVEFHKFTASAYEQETHTEQFSAVAREYSV